VTSEFSESFEIESNGTPLLSMGEPIGSLVPFIRRLGKATCLEEGRSEGMGLGSQGRSIDHRRLPPSAFVSMVSGQLQDSFNSATL